MSGTFIGTQEFADVADLSRQAAHKALVRAKAGKAWRGSLLTVREVTASCGGGRSGVRYEIALSSLPAELQERFSGPLALIETPLNRPAPRASSQLQRQDYQWRVIEDAVARPARSKERRAEVERAAAKWGEPVRTIYRWIADLEAAGGDIAALGRKRPSNAGQRRVHVSRPFDTAYIEAGYPVAKLAELGEHVGHLIKRGWASPAQRAGWKAVRREVLTTLRRDLAERDIALPAKAFHLAQRRIADAQHYRIVDLRAHDRKRYDDMKPRIRRNNALLQPMQQIVMDVKPLDCIVQRPDGSTTWPKMIGFMDTGTHRLFRYFVLLAPGEGVRQEHVAEAFIAMAMHPEWGFPQQLYRDNGTEFYVLDMVREALALINQPGARTIINAKPYSGASKPIESKFAVIDRHVFSQMDGWAGSNRLNKKTQTVGKPPKPYSGSFEEFVQEANERIEVFEHEPIGSGPFKGKSPQQCYAEHVAGGWRPVSVDPLVLDQAFSKHDTRRVDRGFLSIAGTRYHHPDLPNGRTVTVALPWRRGAMPLVQIPELGWAMLQPEMLYLPGEIEGAIEAGRVQQRSDRATRQLGHMAPPLDAKSNHRDRVVELKTRAAPAPLMDVMASQQAQEMADARAQGEAQIARLPSEAERRRAARRRETEDLERYIANKQR